MRPTAAPGTERLRIEEFRVASPRRGARPLVDGVSFSIRAGEVVGLAGLQGSGNSALLLGLFGACRRRTSGAVWLDGRRATLRSPQDAIRQGVALLTNDRKSTGLVLPMSIIANATLAELPRLSPLGWRRPRHERRATEQIAGQLRLRAASLDLETGHLSGGNQQKVAIGKWLLTHPRVLLLDEPTRGIDVGAKQEIYDLIRTWSAQGLAIALITSEMSELLALSDRIMVLHRGRITAEFDRTAATPDVVLAAAMGQEEVLRA